MSKAKLLANKNKPYKKKEGSGGRIEGQKNLQKVYYKTGQKAGQLRNATNKYGVTFTAKEIKELESKVNSVTRKQKRLKQSPVGYMLGWDQKGNLRKSGVDFLAESHSKSLQQFKSKEEYNRYMKRLTEVNKRGYENNLVNEMKRRYKLAINKQFVGGESERREIMSTIDNMSIEEFSSRFGEDIFTEITFVYELEHQFTKMKEIRLGLGLSVDDTNGYKTKFSSPSGKQFKGKQTYMKPKSGFMPKVVNEKTGKANPYWLKNNKSY